MGGARRPRRGRVPLVLLHLEAALGRLPLLAGRGWRVGAPVHQDAVEHLRLLRPLRQRERRGAGRARPRVAERPGPLDPLPAAGAPPRWPSSGWTTTTPPPPGARSRRSSRTSPTGTCAAPVGASGTATRPHSRRCATASSRRASSWRRSPRSWPTPSTTISTAASPRCTCATTPSPMPRFGTPSWSGRWPWRARPWASAARPARTAGSRCASRCARRWWWRPDASAPPSSASSPSCWKS